jgi:hypothetical protein
MPKRGGKAASRRSRQRPVRRPAPPPRPAPTTDPARAGSAATAPTAERAAVPQQPTAERHASPAPEALYGSSVLSQRARAEYHYVARDLRNIGVLTFVIALLLGLAFVLFRVVGLGA